MSRWQALLTVAARDRGTFRDALDELSLRYGQRQSVQTALQDCQLQLERTSRFGSQLPRGTDMTTDADAVILTALPLEAEPFRFLLEGAEEVATPHHRYFRGWYRGKDVAIWPIGRMGNVQTAVATRQAIAVLNPAYLLLSGITGGFLRSDRQLGDVLVPEQVVSYEPSKVREGAVESRFEVFRPARSILQAARTVAERGSWSKRVDIPRPDQAITAPAVHFGVLLSGEKVIASSTWSADILDVWPRASGVEMESVGLMLAAYEAEEAPAAAVVKAISDWADESKGDLWQDYAAYAAAAFVFELIATLPKVDFRRQPQRRDSPLSVHAPPTLKAGWGRKKVRVLRRLSRAEQHELADCMEIEPHEREAFPDEAFGSAVWDWAQRREKLSELPDLLVDCLDRPDLVSLVCDL